MSGRDDLSRLHIFVKKRAGKGGGGGRVQILNFASGNCCHWLPNARHGLLSEKLFSGVIQVARFVPQNNSANKQANNDLHWFGA